jgi:hypothetical protein
MDQSWWPVNAYICCIAFVNFRRGARVPSFGTKGWKLPCIETYIIDLFVPACGCTPCLWLPIVLPPLAAVPALADGEGTARQQEVQPVPGPGLLMKP